MQSPNVTLSPAGPPPGKDAGTTTMTDSGKSDAQLTVEFAIRCALVDTYDSPRTDIELITEAIRAKLFDSAAGCAHATAAYAKELHLL